MYLRAFMRRVPRFGVEKFVAFPSHLVGALDDGSEQVCGHSTRKEVQLILNAVLPHAR